MMEEVKTSYKGVDITYHEHWNRWTCFLNDNEAQATSLKEIKERIDAFMKKENSFKKFDVLVLSSPNGWATEIAPNDCSLGRTATVTSIDEEGNMWVTFDGVRRKLPRKLIPCKLAVLNDENMKKVEEIKEIVKKADELYKTAIPIIKSIKGLDV